jgi:predicted dehydrogenase
MSDKICRWGIMSTASIARKYWLAMQQAENCSLVAVASRDRQRSAQFIGECQSAAPFDPAPQALGSYEELLARDDLDAVYIPVPTGMRKEWVIKAAQAGKHVLAEKPCAPTVAELEQMLAACQENNVQYMDGVMFMHSRRLDLLRQALDDGKSVGPLRRMAVQFSFRAPEDFHQNNIRVNSQLEPLGCLGDLGWYTIRMILWAMNYQLPERVSGRMLHELSRPDSPDRVPGEFSAELFFSGGVSASMYCSFLTEHQQLAHFSGEKGNIYLNDFVLPFFDSEVGFDVANSHFHVDNCTFNMEPRIRRVALGEYSNAAPNSQETNMVRNFANLATSGKLEPAWGERSLATQRVLDACLASAREGGKDVTI